MSNYIAHKTNVVIFMSFSQLNNDNKRIESPHHLFYLSANYTNFPQWRYHVSCFPNECLLTCSNFINHLYI